MPDEQTCGKGLAENAALPAKLAGLIDSLAGVLEHHMADHNMDVLSNGTSVAVFQQFVHCEGELSAILLQRVEAHSKMLQDTNQVG